MAQFTKDQIKRLGRDLMLSLTDEEIEKVIQESEMFMAQLEAIQSLDTEGVAMMDYPFETETNWLRDDVVTHIIPQELAFKNAPKTDGDYFEIVKVIEK